MPDGLPKHFNSHKVTYWIFKFSRDCILQTYVPQRTANAKEIWLCSVAIRRARAASSPSFTLRQQATTELTGRPHSIIACSNYMQGCAILSAHPFRCVSHIQHRAYGSEIMPCRLHSFVEQHLSRASSTTFFAFFRHTESFPYTRATGEATSALNRHHSTAASAVLSGISRNKENTLHAKYLLTSLLLRDFNFNR